MTQRTKYRCTNCGAWVTAREVHTIDDCRKFDQSLALRALHLMAADFSDFVEVRNPKELVSEYLQRAEGGEYDEFARDPVLVALEAR